MSNNNNKLIEIPVLIVALAICIYPLRAEEKRVQVRLSSEEIDEVTFNSGRASEEQIRRWILLSKDGPYHEALASSCMELQADPKSKRFEQERVRAQKLISDLDEANFPAELSEIVRYLKQAQSFWFWRDTKEIAFLKSGDISELEEIYDSIDPRDVCAKPIEKIKNSQSRSEAITAACFDWANCVNGAQSKSFGAYPTEAWKNFLSSYGISEHIISTEEP
jgi:hypothetical protein